MHRYRDWRTLRGVTQPHNILLEVDNRRRLNLSKIGHHNRYTVTEHADGTITLTPAIVLSPAELHYLADAEIQELAERARGNSGKTRHLDRASTEPHANSVGPERSAG